MSTKTNNIESPINTDELNVLLDRAVINYANSPSKTLTKKLVWLLHRTYKQFLIFLIFKLKTLPVKTKKKTFWGEEIIMIGIRPYSLYNAGYIGNDDLFVTQYIINNLKKDEVFIDVGANIGFFTLLASNLVGGSGKIYSFEPIPSTFEYLKTNVSDKNNIVVYQIGIHNKTGASEILDFGIYNNFYNSLGELNKLTTQLADLRENVEVSKYMVNTITLDEFCMQNNVVPNLIKLDTEDTEDLILSTSLETIKKSKPEVIFEMFALSVKEGRLEKILNQFIPLGYRCYQFQDGGIKELKVSTDFSSKYYNYLLTTKIPDKTKVI
jgi:FkbM family methyltransferase